MVIDFMRKEKMQNVVFQRLVLWRTTLLNRTLGLGEETGDQPLLAVKFKMVLNKDWGIFLIHAHTQ